MFFKLTLGFKLGPLKVYDVSDLDGRSKSAVARVASLTFPKDKMESEVCHAPSGWNRLTDLIHSRLPFFSGCYVNVYPTIRVCYSTCCPGIELECFELRWSRIHDHAKGMPMVMSLGNYNAHTLSRLKDLPI
jgi:hypothetical protein